MGIFIRNSAKREARRRISTIDDLYGKQIADLKRRLVAAESERDSLRRIIDDRFAALDLAVHERSTPYLRAKLEEVALIKERADDPGGVNDTECTRGNHAWTQVVGVVDGKSVLLHGERAGDEVLGRGGWDEQFVCSREGCVACLFIPDPRDANDPGVQRD